MKILHVIASVWRGGGGTSEVVPRICRAQRETGHEVTLAVALVGPYSDSCAEAIAAGVVYESFPRIRAFSSIGYSPAFRAALPRLVGDADIVHLHGLWQSPCWFAAAECRRQGKPYVVMPHGFLEPERLKISKWKKRLVGALIERKNLRNAAAIIATSESEADGIRKYGLENPIHIMPIGLDLEPFLAPIPHMEKTLLYFSRITPIKGLDMLAEAWSMIDRKGWRLLIVGPDDRGYTETMKTLFAEKCPAGSYEFRGPVFGADKYRLLASVDALILPTRSENWSIAVAEGMAAGLPVICTKGAPWQCLETAQAGYWVGISVDAIKSAIVRLISLSDDERHAMGVRARAWVARELNWGMITSRIVEAYKSYLDGAVQ